MYKIKNFLGILLLICLSLINLPFSAKAENIIVTFNPISYTHDRYPELSGTISDPMADVSVFVGGNGTMAENHGDGTWIVPLNSFGPFADGTYDVRVLAENESTGKTDSNDYLGGLIVKDDYSMPPELDCSTTVDSSNVGEYSVQGMAESNAAVHILFNDHFGASIEALDFADWSGNFVFSPIDITSLWDGEITITAIAIDNSGMGAMSEETIITINKNTASLSAPTLNIENIIKQNNQNDFAFSGSSTPNGKLYYNFKDLNDLEQSGFVNIDGNGVFLVVLYLSSLADGDVTVKIGSESGNERSVLVTQTIIKDTSGPEIYNASTGAYRDVDRFLANVEGFTLPNSVVRYDFQNLGSNVSGEVYSNIDGKFELRDIDLSSLPDGEVTLSLLSVDEINNEGAIITKTLAKEPLDDQRSIIHKTDSVAAVSNQTNPVVVTANVLDDNPVAGGMLPKTGPDSAGILILIVFAILIGLRLRILS